MTSEELVKEVYTSARDLAWHLTNTKEDQEDLIQDSIAKAIKGLPSFKGKSSAKTWFHKIMLNTWKNNVVKNNNRSSSLVMKGEFTKDMIDKTYVDTSTLDKDLIREETRQMLDKALRGLEKHYQESIRLYYLEGMSIKDIAKTLSISKNTISTRLVRGRIKLRSILQTSESI